MRFLTNGNLYAETDPAVQTSPPLIEPELSTISNQSDNHSRTRLPPYMG